MTQCRYSLYGFCVVTDYRFRSPMAKAAPDAKPDLVFSCKLARFHEHPKDECFHLSGEKNRYGESLVELYAKQDGILMRFPRIAEFLLRPEEILCRLYKPEWHYMVEICLLGHVFACYLELKGRAALHAGAVAIGHQAVLFAADRTGGKSTLVASMASAGLPLLADDIVSLEEGKGGVTCHRGFPQLKLTPEQAERFAGRASDFPLVHPEFDKLSVPAEQVGPVAAQGLPVARLYLLERQPRLVGAEQGKVDILPLTPGDAVIQLIRHSFLAHTLDGIERRHGLAAGAWSETRCEGAFSAAQRLHRLARMSQALPIRRLRYTTGYEFIPAIQEAIESDLNSAPLANSG